MFSKTRFDTLLVIRGVAQMLFRFRLVRRHAALSTALWCACSLTAVSADGQSASTKSPAVNITSVTTNTPVAAVTSFPSPTGSNVFAISVPAINAGGVANQVAPEKGTPEKAATARQHVLLVDTSASQTGDYRESSITTVVSALQNLPASDRVQLIAFDVTTAQLTSEFVAPKSAAAAAAVAALRERTPMGACDLAAGLSAALKIIPADAAGSVIFVGDGMSAANLVQIETLQNLSAAFRSRQIPVHIVAIGARTDLELLGSIASHTGGFIATTTNTTPTETGSNIAAAAVRPVLYPTSIELEPATETLLPTLLPMRTDRDTVLVGRGMADDYKGTITVETKIAGKAVRQQFPVEITAASKANAFVDVLYQSVSNSGGVVHAATNTAMLNRALDEFNVRIDELIDLAQRAIANRDLKRAEDIATGIRNLDPYNATVDQIFAATERIRRLNKQMTGKIRPASFTQPPAKPGADEPVTDEETTTEEATSEDATTAEPATTEEPTSEEPAMSGEPAGEDAAGSDKTTEVAEPAVVLPGANEETTVRTVDPLDLERMRREIRAEQLTQEVNTAIEAAQRASGSDPQAAVDELKRRRATVQSETSIDADKKQAIIRRLDRETDRIVNRMEKLAQDSLQRLQRNAQKEAQRVIAEQVTNREQRLEQIIDKVRGLLEEGAQGRSEAFEEAEASSRETISVDPYSGVSSDSIFLSEVAGQIDKAFRIRYERADKFLATLNTVEEAHIPFPDEPPLLYPPPQVWQALTERRKKWADVDLSAERPAERRIRAELERPSDADFTATPLKDAILYLSERHKINIILKDSAIESSGFTGDSPVDLKVNGIALNSVLRLLLKDFKLSFIIDDEVMKIVTEEDATSPDSMVTRVYPVGDLVIPIEAMGGGGIGGGLGGGGLGGGMGGGLGGGGLGGGGGGFGGGGMFSVPVNTTNTSNDAGADHKKKPATHR